MERNGSEIKWAEQRLTIEVAIFADWKRACDHSKQRGWVSKCVTLAAANRSGRTRQPIETSSLAISLDQPLNIDAPEKKTVETLQEAAKAHSTGEATVEQMVEHTPR